MADEPWIVRPGVDADLGMIASEIEALRDLASDSGEAQDGARVYDFSIRWGILLSGRLKRLERYYRAGNSPRISGRATGNSGAISRRRCP